MIGTWRPGKIIGACRRLGACIQANGVSLDWSQSDSDKKKNKNQKQTNSEW